MNNTNRLQRQGETLIPAIAYGDATGLPVETRTAEYIAAREDGPITKLVPTKENPYFGSTEHPGVWSDDTQLTLAVAHSLIQANGFNMAAIAANHLIAYGETPFITRQRDGKQVKRGWGGSTVSAMEELRKGVDPTQTGSVTGEGNGVLMKMAPLAFWQAAQGLDDAQRYEQLDLLTNLTHNNPLTRLTSRVHGDVLNYLMMNDYDKKGLLEVLDDSITRHEFETNTPGQLRDLLGYLHREDIDQQTILTHTDRKGFHAPQTLAMAYGAFMAHKGNFTPTVYEAVNLGGDTDSTASIVAAMSNFATKEVLRMPIDHQNIERLDELKAVSRELAVRAFL